MNRLVDALPHVYCLFTLSACSVAMAMSGNPEPQFDAFEVGSSRKQVELQLGSPAGSRVLESGKKEDTYKYQVGNSPNGHRALMNLYLDLATLMLWEFPGTIVEAMMGENEESRIVYGPDDRVLEIHGYRPPSPSPELEAARKAQDQHRNSSQRSEQP